MPTLRYEPPSTLPQESYCLQKVGANLTMACQNPANLSFVRASGSYCEDYSVPPTYQVYAFQNLIASFTALVNYTLKMDSGPVTYNFKCDLSTASCSLLNPNLTLPNFGPFYPIFAASFFSTNLYWTSLITSRLIIQSPARLYPHRTLPSSSFFVAVGQVPKIQTRATTPDCILPEGDWSWENKSAIYFPSGLRKQLSDYWMDPSSITLSVTPLSPLHIYSEQAGMAAPGFVEFDMFIPDSDANLADL